jgi:hypothetical protein
MEKGDIGNELAFPHMERESDYPLAFAQYGLTKRELFAAMALQGMVSGSNAINFEKAAICSVRCADLLIEKLNITD